MLHGRQALQGAGYAAAHESFGKFAALFRTKAQDSWLRADVSSWCAAGFGKEKFDRLKEAILGKKIITFTKFSAEKRVSERVAEPLRLLFRGRAWHVSVFARVKSREMVLRASRIGNVHVTEETLKRVLRQDPMARPEYATEYPLQRGARRVASAHAFRVFAELPEQDMQPQPDGTFLINEPLPVNAWLTAIFFPLRLVLKSLSRRPFARA